jgi:hypothetical protein
LVLAVLALTTPQDQTELLRLLAFIAPWAAVLVRRLVLPRILAALVAAALKSLTTVALEQRGKAMQEAMVLVPRHTALEAVEVLEVLA